MLLDGDIHRAGVATTNWHAIFKMKHTRTHACCRTVTSTPTTGSVQCRWSHIDGSDSVVVIDLATARVVSVKVQQRSASPSGEQVVFAARSHMPQLLSTLLASLRMEDALVAATSFADIKQVCSPQRQQRLTIYIILTFWLSDALDTWCL